ncbi:MAG TPA: UDP-glucose/GDP-mannose dehydrogenase family protein [Ktedonobacterales bacterium]|nr:UDP-glucose/GDP-mannose dehydrogenase family protein [Ktedonobacterales bacterium]
MRTISVIGTGYVGLVTGTCLADLGNTVICIDIDPEKIACLQRGEMPIYEPGLKEVIDRNVEAERLSFTTSYADGLRDAEFVFIAVNTPTTDKGTDMRYVTAAATSIAEHLDHDAIIVTKSTMPVGSGDLVSSIISQHLKHPEIAFSVVSNPEFLAQGTAVADCQRPDRIVLGSSDHEAASRVDDLYLPLRAPIMLTDLYTAEMIKYASNAFLATKISFINEMARICERLGADVKEVAVGMGYDHRIGRFHLEAGVGFGGSCFGKDVNALAHMAAQAGLHPQMLNTVLEINHDQRRLIVDKVQTLLGTLRGTTIGVLGLAFKPNTDDMRDAPSIDIIHALLAQGAHVQAYDPVARETARAAINDDRVEYCTDAYATATGADALIIVTHWNEFKALNPTKLHAVMHRPILVDGRNIYQPDAMARAGFIYRGIGRPAPVGEAELAASGAHAHPQNGHVKLAETGKKE